jgi:5-methylcytosine-specific restriction endonuclease McrA
MIATPHMKSHEKRPQTFKKGYVPWNKGLKMSQETKDKLSKIFTGKPAWNKGKQAPWVSDRNRVMNRDRIRDKHPNWKGGVTKIDKCIRQMPEYKVWRSQVFERDNWTCMTCQSKGYVTAHHIKSFASILRENSIKNTLQALECSLLWDINNGVTLCETCHSLTDNYRGRNKTDRNRNTGISR